MLNLLNSLAVSFDLPILDWIQSTLQSGFMDFIMPIITIFGDADVCFQLIHTKIQCKINNFINFLCTNIN